MKRHEENTPAIVEAYRGGKSILHLTHKFKHSKRIISQILHEHAPEILRLQGGGRPHTPEEVALIIRKYKAGESCEKIAQELGNISRPTVQNILRRHAPGLILPRRERARKSKAAFRDNRNALTFYHSELGQRTVGQCQGCGIEMVGPINAPEGHWVCCAGLDFNNRAYARRVG